MGGILVAIDGPAGSGKSSVARAVAGRLGVVNLSTGAAYRAAALLALREDVDLTDAEGLAALARRVALDPEGASIDGTRRGARSPLPRSLGRGFEGLGPCPPERGLATRAEGRAEKARARGGAVVEGEISVPSSFLTLNLRFTYPPLQKSGRAGGPLRRAGGELIA